MSGVNGRTLGERFNFPWLGLLKWEFVGSLRQVRSFVVLCLVVGAMIFSTYSGLMMGASARGMSFGAAGMASEMLFRSFSTSLYVIVAIVIPALAATTIATERQRGTFGQLMLAPLHEREVLWYKVLSVFGFFLLIVIAAMPIAGVLFFLIGIDWAQFGTTVVSASMVAFFGSIVGVSVSTRYDNVRGAISRTLGIQFLLYLFGACFLGLAFGAGAGGFLFTLIIYALLSAVVFSIAVGLLREPLKEKKETHLFNTSLASLLPVLMGRHGNGAAMHDAVDRPIARSVFDTRGKRRRALFLIYGLSVLPIAVISLLISSSVMDFQLEMVYWWISVEGFIVALFLAPLVATRMAKEYEGETMEMLKMTLLRPAEILVGQFRQYVVALGPLLAGILTGGVILVVQSVRYGMQIWEDILLAHSILFVLIAAGVCVCQLAGILSRRSGWALVLGWGMLAGTTALGSRIVAFIVSNFVYGRWNDDYSVMVCMMVVGLSVGLVCFLCTIKLYPRLHRRQR